MTNLEIIKYLAFNNPARLAELLDDIYCTAWNHGSYAAVSKNPFSENEIDDFNEWIGEEANTNFFYDHELEEWSKAIDSPPTITAFYDSLSVTLPVDDPDHLWNKDIYNSKYEVIDKAIDEIKLLENIVESEKYSDDVYGNFREKVCSNCYEPYCMCSDIEIYDCPKFENYVKEHRNERK